MAPLARLENVQPVTLDHILIYLTKLAFRSNCVLDVHPYTHDATFSITRHYYGPVDESIKRAWQFSY